MLGVALALLSAAGPTPLQKAEKLVDELQYAAALPELDAALARSGNTRDDVVKINWLKGMINALLARPDAARLPLRTVASIAPEWKPDEGQPSRVMTSWFEAKGWAQATGTLGFQRGNADATKLRVSVENDALKLSRAVRFHWREDAGPWRIRVIKQSAKIESDCKGTRVEWWAELLGEKDGVLVLLGSERAPLLEQIAVVEPVAAAPPQTPPPEPAPAPAPAPAAPPEPEPAPPAAVAVRSGPPTPLTQPLQLAGYGSLALAAAAGGLGAYFGSTARAEAARLTGAEHTPDGAITGITQRDAAALAAQQRMHASLANTFFIGAGVLAAAGVGLWVMGFRLAPAPGGASLSGELP